MYGEWWWWKTRGDEFSHTSVSVIISIKQKENRRSLVKLYKIKLNFQYSYEIQKADKNVA